MIAPSFTRSLLKSIAIYLIAACAFSMTATGQNAPQKAIEKADEQAERTRIKSERAKLNESLAQQRQACYQKLAVTPCLNEARDQNNEKMRDLKRQEVALNDVQRKRAAADRVKALDERNSPEAQLKRAQDRGKAMDAAAKREESRAERQASREAKQAQAANVPQAAKEPKPEGASPAPQGKPRQQPAAKLAPEQRPGQAAKMEKSRRQAAEREKAAEMRRAEALQREAKRKKPAAAALPIPD
jgi:colicin import membrane protein